MCIRDRVSTQSTWGRVQSPMGAPAPIFLSAGAIVHLQDSNSIKSIRDLNNEFNFVIGLNKTAMNFYTAHGKFMPLTTENYLDVDSVEKCLAQHCVLNVNAHVIEYPNKVLVELDFTNDKSSVENPVENINMKQIRFYGLKSKAKTALDNNVSGKDIVGSVKKDGAEIGFVNAQFSVQKFPRSNDITLTLDLSGFSIEKGKKVEFSFQ
eukprot:TRINITY_DN7170_c0_g2_i1.p1 TRINITY_DN7170_c0_g2~~TRINITY_DN7170_c0_g2_i1.p1  ORF type:complete len:208 (+),score=52.24 TRINITY_DN7170_c0_g2_i1:64-687(+)